MAALYTIIIAALVALDQISKRLAVTYLAPAGSAPLVPGIIGLTFHRNDGAAFGSFSGMQLPLIIITSVMLAVLFLYLVLYKNKTKVETAALILVVSGGIGNLIDRVLFKSVVDFFNFEFVNFAVFNVADTFICVGIALYVLNFIYTEFVRKGKNHEKA